MSENKLDPKTLKPETLSMLQKMWKEVCEESDKEEAEKVDKRKEKAKLKKEAADKAYADLISKGYELENLTSDEWIILEKESLDERHDKAKVILSWFEELGYTRISRMNSIYDYIAFKEGDKYVEAVIIMIGEYADEGRTICPGIQLTETLIEKIDDPGYICIQDCLKNISYYNGNEDMYYSGNTYRWDFEYGDLNLKGFVEHFKNTLDGQ